jgi:tetratricopeptide (TPR) repeat protein
MDLDYAIRGDTVSDDELREIIAEADAIIESNCSAQAEIADNKPLATAYLKKAQSLQKMDNFEDTKELAEKALELSPDMPQALLRLYYYYEEKEEFDLAFEYINKALEKDPAYIYAYYMRGLGFDNKGDYDKAIEDYTEALRLKPDFARALSRRAAVFMCEEDYGKAIADFDKAILINPNSAYLFIDRGDVYYYQEEYDKAIADYSEAIRLDPSNASAFKKRGDAYYSKEEYDKVIADYSEAIRLDPNKAAMFIARGQYYREKGEYDKAIADYNDAVRLNPNFLYVFRSRGSLYTEMGEYDKAIADFDEAIRLKPGYARAFYSRGYVYKKNGEYDKAIADYNEAIRLNQNYHDVFDSRGSLYTEMGEYDKALTDFNEALRLKPNYEDAYAGRALALEKTEKYAEAFNDYLLAAKMNQKYSKKFLDYIDTLLSDPAKADLLWDLPLVQIERAPHFFVSIICGFRRANRNSPAHKRLIHSVFSFWDSCRCKEDDLILNQFTNLAALEGMRNSRKLRLFPINYQNDPEEGQVFYQRLTQYFKEQKIPTDNIDSITAHMSEKVAFIRSLTTHGNSLLMWNSSYAAGSGVSVGIASKRINKGQGLSKEIVQEEAADADGTQKKTPQGSQKKEAAESDVPIGKMGLYKIFYSEKSINFDENKMLMEIADCLAAFEEKEFTDEFKILLLELFTSIAHLVKDVSYEHEKEYRLLYIDSIKDNPYIKDSISNGVFNGIYIDTEPVLFEDDEIPIYFSPTVDDISIQKYRHAFMLKGLPLKGTVEKLLRPSGIKFR